MTCDTIINAAAVIGCVLCGADKIEPPCQYFGWFSTVAERVIDGNKLQDTIVKSFTSIDSCLSPFIQSWFTEWQMEEYLPINLMFFDCTLPNNLFIVNISCRFIELSLSYLCLLVERFRWESFLSRYISLYIAIYRLISVRAPASVHCDEMLSVIMFNFTDLFDSFWERSYSTRDGQTTRAITFTRMIHILLSMISGLSGKTLQVGEIVETLVIPILTEDRRIAVSWCHDYHV